MLKPKKLSENTGAGQLASMMMGYTQGKSVHELPLSQLQDAPAEWNFFKPLPSDKFFELVESIEKNGLLNPLLVWEKTEKEYMLLSGHNRKRALELIFDKTSDSRYGNAPCILYQGNALDEDVARNILVDCNWVQRTLSPAEKAQAVYYKYVTMGRRSKGEGRGYEAVAAHFGLKATQVYQYYQMAQLDPEWLARLDAGVISIKAAAHLAKLSAAQRELLKEYMSDGAIGNSEILSILKKDTPEDMKVKLQKKERMRELRMLVPENRYDEAVELLEKWMSEG